MASIDRRNVLKGAAATAVAAALGHAGAGLAAAAETDHGAADLARFDTPGDKDFPKVGGNLGNQNYTSLRSIHHGNIARLRGAWVNRIEGGLASGNSQSTTVAVDGVLYIESALGNVIAVDGVPWTGIGAVRDVAFVMARGEIVRKP